MSITRLQRHPALYAHIEAQGNLIAIKASFSALGKTGGGHRGIVTEFTAASRLRLLRKMARIAPKKVTFLTLTYPARFPNTIEAKGHLRALFERFRRRYPQASAFWRLEFQDRGAPHFHVLFFDLPFVPFHQIREWWRQIICSYVDGQLPFVRIEKINSRRGAFYYVSKYAAKLSKASDNPSLFNFNTYPHAGRYWGVFNRGHLPYAERFYAIVEITTAVGFAACKALLDDISPTLYPNRYRGKCCLSPNALAVYRLLYDLLEPDMIKTFVTRFQRWTHDHKQIQPTQKFSHPRQAHLRLRMPVLPERQRVSG